MTRTDDGLEGRRRVLADVAAGRRLAADDPRIDARGGGIAQLGQPAVPVAVLRQDGSGGRLVERGQRLGLCRTSPSDQPGSLARTAAAASSRSS